MDGSGTSIRPCSVRRLSLSEIEPAPYNPRKISPEAEAALGESLRRFGLVEPLVWNARTGHLVSGHQRLAELHRCGVREVDVSVVDLDLPEEKALNLALNNPESSGFFTESAGTLVREIGDAISEALNLSWLDSKAEPALAGEVMLEDFVPQTVPPLVWLLVSAPADVASEIELLVREGFGENPLVIFELSGKAK